jgi:hypothetical protein
VYQASGYGGEDGVSRRLPEEAMRADSKRKVRQCEEHDGGSETKQNGITN